MHHLRFVILMCAIFLTSCGYTTGSLLPSNYKTIHVEHFPNKVTYINETSRSLYIPLLESRAREAIVDRFLFDGHLRVSDSDRADLILQGELTGFERSELRLTDNQDVEEFRIQITVSLTMTDPVDQKVLWREPSFVGEATYFTTGPQARSEAAALEEALTDLARRVVERMIEDW